MARCLLTLALALSCTGCFVLDELDKGAAIMEENSPKKPPAEGATAKAPGGDGKGEPPKPTGTAWWSQAKSLGTGPGDAADAGDPKAPVTCKIAGKTRFMRRADCLSQGGRPT